MRELLTPLLVVISTLTIQSVNIPYDSAPPDMLQDIQIRQNASGITYNRNGYSYGIDADHDGQNTRAELLIKFSNSPVSFTNDTKRTVKSGEWFDNYTGVTFKNASDVDIDHLVPLYEVHLSGGHAWSDEKKRSFANDLGENSPLRITHRWTNRIPKNADDPAFYSPSYVPARCTYLYDWINIKRKWELSMDPQEADALRNQIRACA